MVTSLLLVLAGLALLALGLVMILALGSAHMNVVAGLAIFSWPVAALGAAAAPFLVGRWALAVAAVPLALGLVASFVPDGGLDRTLWSAMGIRASGRRRSAGGAP